MLNSWKLDSQVKRNQKTEFKTEKEIMNEMAKKIQYIIFKLNMNISRLLCLKTVYVILLGFAIISLLIFKTIPIRITTSDAVESVESIKSVGSDEYIPFTNSDYLNNDTLVFASVVSFCS